MGHGSRGSWVISLMGQMCHRPQNVTHRQLCFIFVVCSKYVSILHRFRDIMPVTTITAYVTACDLQEFIVFITQLKLQAVFAFRFI